MNLVIPSVEYKNSYIEAVKEFKEDSDTTKRSQEIKKLSISELEADFENFVDIKNSRARGENLQEGWVPFSEYWLIDGGEYIGAINIRHRLIESLEKYYGHIGYDIRPSKRGKGYATEMLKLVLPKAKELGLNSVLITCLTTNPASRRVIEKNGGVFIDQVHQPDENVDLLRFSIDIA